MLFTETDSTGAAETAPYIIRSRFVKLNLELLIGENGGPRALKEISANLFPDVVYTCIIRHVENNAGSYSWVGSLKGVENSEFVMVYTAGVFMGHFASPEGVYEVSNAGDDIYRVIMIDQQKLQDHGE